MFSDAFPIILLCPAKEAVCYLSAFKTFMTFVKHIFVKDWFQYFRCYSEIKKGVDKITAYENSRLSNFILRKEYIHHNY